MNNSEERIIEINDKKPKKLGFYIWPWIKTRRALGIKVVLGRMIDLRKKNCSVHCATNNWMIVIADGKARRHKMMTSKIIELDQLLIPSSQMKDPNPDQPHEPEGTSRHSNGYKNFSSKQSNKIYGANPFTIRNISLENNAEAKW